MGIDISILQHFASTLSDNNINKQVVLKKEDSEIKRDLTFIEQGLWELKLEGDYENYLYHYEVRVDLECKKTLDPYALSSTTDSLENYIIDPKKLSCGA